MSGGGELRVSGHVRVILRRDWSPCASRQHGSPAVSRRATPRGGGSYPSGVPFSQVIVKMHGRCNLACRYCYLYEGPDSGWRDRPAAAPPGVLDRTAERIAEHAATHGLREVALVLHGGEPLL